MISEYFETHAIRPSIADLLGVRIEGETLVFPYAGHERRRTLPGPTIQPKGVPLTAWAPCGVRETVVLCEGEGDLLAAASTIFTLEDRTPRRTHGYFEGLTPVGIPGASMNAERLLEGILDAGTVYLVLDGDEAGRKASARLGAAIADSGRHAVRVELPDGFDLADFLVRFDPEDRPDGLANLLLDAWTLYCDSGEFETRDLLNRVRSL